MSEVIFWGLIELELQEAIELFSTRVDAEAALAEVLADQPEWSDLLRVEAIELEGLSWN